ncbi:MAG: hypothetical protein LQ348_005631 [Seirophora lacunosa]|nr:MAG: hypothetical protein LQ348_005631 [Seirophora lacunosa]
MSAGETYEQAPGIPASPVFAQGHVSAFAAWQKAHAPLSDASHRPHYPRSEVRGGHSEATEKRQSVQTKALSALQKSKRRKTKNIAKERSGTQAHPSTCAVTGGTIQGGLFRADGLAAEKVTMNVATNCQKGELETDHQESHLNLLVRESRAYSRGPSSQSDSEENIEVQPPSDREILKLSQIVTATDRQLSTFVPTEKNVVKQTSTAWTVSLKEGDVLCLVGQYDIWIRKGAISVFGATLRQSSRLYRVFAPSTHSLPSVRPLRNPFGPGNQETLITISNCNSGLRLLGQASPKLSRLWNKASFRSDGTGLALDLSNRTFTFLGRSSDDAYKRPLRVIETPSDWQALIAALTSLSHAQQNKTLLVCGPKGSGKSTFSKMLTNALLTIRQKPSDTNNSSRDTPVVAFLDVDPGQPEFSPPGEICLVQLLRCNLGPSFSHPVALDNGVQLVRAHHIGSISPKNDPQHYSRCVLDLIRHYKQMLVQYPSCPLIVNTAGWIQGTGLELLEDFIGRIGPTDIIYTSTQGPSEVVETISKAATEASIPLHFLVSQPAEVASRNAADLRMMQTMSYFHLDELEKGNLRWNATPINEMAPMSVHYAGPNQALFGVLLQCHELEPECVAQILEGCIVGLVVVEDNAALQQVIEGHDSRASSSEENSNDDHDDNVSPPSDSADPDPMPLSFKEARNYNHIPSLPRTPDQIPYIPFRSSLTPPLPPAYTYSIGQALVDSIEPYTQTLNLITPVPSSTLNALHDQRKRIILVRGNLETPTWAYKEDLYMQMSRRKRIAREGLYAELAEAWGQEDSRKWAEGRRWVSFAEKGRKGKVRRTRRNLGKKKAE